MKNGIHSLLAENPIVAAVKDEAQLREAVTSGCPVIFLLFGDLLHIVEMVEIVKSAGKIAVVHADLINGLASREVAVDFLKASTRADGVISTKPAIIKRAGELGLVTVQRSFIFDSLSLETMKKQVLSTRADFVEILPAAMPKILREIVQTVNIPVIAGGLIRDKEDIVGALGAGVLAISSTSRKVWFM